MGLTPQARLFPEHIGTLAGAWLGKRIIVVDQLGTAFLD
jgi:hypothetical protein